MKSKTTVAILYLLLTLPTSGVAQQHVVLHEGVDRILIEHDVILDHGQLNPRDTISPFGSSNWNRYPVSVTSSFDKLHQSRLISPTGEIPSAVVYPTISSSEEFDELFSPRDAPRTGIIRKETFQVVPGIPNDERFSSPKFNKVREGFSVECVASAKMYFEALRELGSRSDYMGEIVDQNGRNMSNEYDSNCLVHLADVPEGVREVVGILTIGGRPFCSATIVGEKLVVTSRHCFYDADSGEATPHRIMLGLKKVVFVPLSNVHQQKYFDVRTRTAANIEERAFAPYEDQLLLRVSGGNFRKFAKRANAISVANQPIPVWVVGSNALLGDVNKVSHPLQLVRGSAPNACSILSVTDKGCVYHSCQAGASTSGAGLIFLTEDGAQLIGVHKGPATRANNCEIAPPLTFSINLAALYNGI